MFPRPTTHTFGVHFFIALLGIPLVYVVFFTTILFPEGLVNRKLSYLSNTEYSQDLFLQSATKEVTSEYIELVGLEEFKRSHAFDMTVGYVVGRDVDLYNALVINKGSGDGVKQGDLVVVGKGVLVGNIISTTSHRSTVILLNDPFVSFTVKLLGQQEEIGVTKGNISVDITIDLIPQNTDIQPGDVVVTSSLTGNTPEGLVIGVVKRIIGSTNQLFKQAIIESPVDVFNYSTVGIIHKRNEHP